MKIKTVCQETGLSDRTIRYYIEEELISPHYTENYLGRKTFDFSPEDIRELQDIAILRKFGFSIEDIRRIKLNPWQSITIIAELRRQKQALIAENTQALDALCRLDGNKVYTVAELAADLAAPATDKPLPPEDRLVRVERLLWLLLKRLPAIVLAGLPLVAFVVGLVIHYSYAYPVWNGFRWYGTFLLLLPTVCLSLLYLPGRKPLTQRRQTVRKWVRGVALVLCGMYVPLICFSWIIHFSGGPSSTTNPSAYLKLDESCPAPFHPIFQKLFPPSAPENGEYYYWYETSVFGEKYDIFAQWVLPQEAFEEEVLRAEKLYDQSTTKPQKPYAAPLVESTLEQVTIQEGKYTCLIWYERSDGRMPFSPMRSDYQVCIFAYQPATRQVRYILCESTQGGIPYYLEIDW